MEFTLAFKGVSDLRDEHERIEITPEQASELAKCVKDPIYFIKNYVYINTKDKGVQKFSLWNYQEDLIRKFDKYRFNIVKFGRQLGKSATTRAFILWYSIFNADKVVAILSNKLSGSMEQMYLLRESYLKLPKFLQPGIVSWNKKSIEFSTGTRIFCAATSSDSITGTSVNLLYLDEFALVPHHKADDFIGSVFPTISSGQTTKIIITSCVVKDTMVFTPEGIKTVGDFIIDDGRVMGYDVQPYKVLGRYGMNDGHIMHNDGEAKETRIITTRYSEVETSLMHKFWSCRDGVYKIRRAHELKEGDYVMVKYGMNCWGDDRIEYDDTGDRMRFHLGKIDEITEDMAYFFGLYIAEGCAMSNIERNYVIITCGDDISSAFDRIGVKYECRDGIHYRTDSKALCQLLKYVGFDLTRHAKQKIIPDRLMRMSKKCVAAMLRGMFDGDGCSEKKRKRISYTSTSKRLIDQVRILLANFGILSNVYHNYTKPTKKVRVQSEVWKIEVTNSNMVDLYFDEIGFGLARKSITRDMQKQHSTRSGPYDYIPFSAPEIRRLKKEKVLTNKEFVFTGGICDKNDIHLSRKLILGIKSKLPEEVWSKYDVFRNAEPDCVWVPIISIKKSHNKVYDFSLNDDNYNGYLDAEWSHSVIHNLFTCLNTPRGMNHFFRLWEDAGDTQERSVNGFVRSAATWQVCPTRTKEWAEREMQQIGEIKFNQEHLCSFIGSVSTLIDHKFLSTMKARDPIKLPGLIKYVRLYELPLKKRVLETNGWEYVASLDSGYGVHKDSSVLQICLVKNNIDVEQVAVVSCNSMDIKEFSQMSREVLKQYYDPGLIIEQNGPGIAAIKYFNEDFEYENLIHFDTHGNKLGLWASENLKSTACILMKTYIQRKYAKVYDYDTINELYSFGQTSATKWGAMGGTHDDHVTSLMYIFLYLQSGLFYGNVVDSGDLGYSLGVDINEEVKISNKAAMLRLASDPNALADEFNAAADYKIV